MKSVWSVGPCLGAAVFVACVAAGCGGGEGGSDVSDSGAGGGQAGGAGGSGGATGGSGGGTTECYRLADGECVVETFANPAVLSPDANGVYQLELGPTEFMVDGKRHCGRSYNGLYPSPTIDIPAARDGEQRRVRVDMRNRFTKADVRDLSSGDCICTDADSGMSCDPTAGHGGHGGHTSCVCRTDDGDMCHLFDFNTTNLHAHGSHVRPDYATGGGCVEADGLRCRSCSGDRDAEPRECYFADDVISRVAPGEGVRHRWDLDEDGVHHEGLDWYHPHIHGSTAIQVASGATGALIIRGPVDELPGIKDARERVFLVMTPPVDYPALEDGQPCDEDHITFNDFAILGDTSKKQATLINGIRRPRLVMAPGQIERWRFLHGAFLDETYIAVFRGNDSSCEDVDLAGGPIPLTQIARDGLTMPRPPGGTDWPYAPDYLFLSPGYRVDALFDANAFADGDTLCVRSARFLQTDPTAGTGEAVGLLEPPTPEVIFDAFFNGETIAIVNVTASAGEPTETQMPDLEALATHAPSMMLQGGTVDALARCEEVAAVTEPEEIDQAAVMWAVFYENEGLDACGIQDHNINGRNFEYTDRTTRPYDRVLTKGAVDHWRLTAGFDGHPFHIHINPFLVCPLPAAGSPHPNTKARLFEPPFAHWRDTYLVNLDRSHDLLAEYKAHTGDFVFHCHKLNHEDHGMMELVRVCDPEVESCDTLCNGGPCTWRTCAEGDDDCRRELASADCFLNPASCPEALLRCAPCGGAEGTRCPPGARCDDEAGPDGTLRCVPGCAVDDDCGAPDACHDGTCEPTAPCQPPCGPGSMCLHGACR